MEEEMMEDGNNSNVMDEEMEGSFMDNEIDFDYEFDAARFFDFSRAESLAETRYAELWFQSAGSYPPSPFVARLVQREDIALESINTSPKPKDVEIMKLSDSKTDIEAHQEISALDMNCVAYGQENEGKDGPNSTNLQVNSVQMFQNLLEKLPSGLNFYNDMVNNTSSTKTKLPVKQSFPRISTLMKPTVSQLAKQNRPLQAGDFRSKKSFVEGHPCGIENQAAKRQKLEGGHLRKVQVVGAVQQTSFVHKAPKQVATVNGNMMQANSRITIPREPDLETAHRAQRIRPKARKEAENMTSAIHGFKALPLNRKILEAPSLLLPKRSTPQLPDFQEFHLKTSERAMHHSSAVSTSILPCSSSDKALHEPNANSCMESANVESRRSNLMDALRPEGLESSYGFKALPLNQKILSSKGDIGVFRNYKKEITVPMEFNFQTEKRVQHNPPIELLNKLSLASNQPTAGSQTKVPLPYNSIPIKGSKENRWSSFQQEREIKLVVKQKLTSFGGKQIPSGPDGRKEAGPVSGINRGMGIR
ncbi:protein TPX2 isoform X3 [Olea europaea var. sylvestris]|uniref:protein TPX2 isoform X3 n=1 Tax=Olea europaea var. sylvestris TaxID=158386 RepID=UPI000C1D768E|nr:protein TPX2 isoform X3 [Olea europaea var. sylvestris]